MALAAIVLSACTLFWLNRATNQKQYFKLDDSIEIIFCGHSHIQLAINDSLVAHSMNFGESGENFIYTYQKLKCLLNSNAQIKHVFLACSNNSICEHLDERSWNEHFVKSKVPKFSFALDKNDLGELISHSPMFTISAMISGAEIESKFFVSNEMYYPKFAKWDGYYRYTKSAVDSLLQLPEQLKIPEKGLLRSQHALDYLQKINSLCLEKNVRLSLIRCPIHPGWEYNANELLFTDVMQNELAALPFYDFANYSLPNGDYRDFEHLNCYGAKKFSLHVDSLIRAGYFE